MRKDGLYRDDTNSGLTLRAVFLLANYGMFDSKL